MHYKIHLAQADHYRLGYYEHCSVYIAHYNNYFHLASGNSMLLLGSCHLGAQLNTVHLMCPIEQQQLQP